MAVINDKFKDKYLEFLKVDFMMMVLRKIPKFWKNFLFGF
jgi:hypothetical protein